MSLWPFLLQRLYHAEHATPPKDAEARSMEILTSIEHEGTHTHTHTHTHSFGVTEAFITVDISAYRVLTPCEPIDLASTACSRRMLMS